jgi:hypothetical protein
MLGGLGGSLLVAGSCLAVVVATHLISRPERWEIPAGYRGWLVLRYNQSGCPPLPTQGLTQVIRFDLAGQACTSSAAAGGWYEFTAVYLHPDGTQSAIPIGRHRPNDLELRFQIGDGRGGSECGLLGTEADLALPPPAACGHTSVIGP